MDEISFNKYIENLYDEISKELEQEDFRTVFLAYAAGKHAQSTSELQRLSFLIMLADVIERNSTKDERTLMSKAFIELKERGKI